MSKTDDDRDQEVRGRPRTMNTAELETGRFPAELVPMDLPEPTFERARWANLRQENVEKVAERWQADENLVLLLGDRKLGRSDLAVLRKDYLERLLSILRDLQSGHIGLRYEIQGVRDSSIALQKLVAANQALVESAIPQIVQILVRSVTRIEASFVVQRDRPDLAPTQLTDEERASLKEDDKEGPVDQAVASGES